ncbi:MAG: MFS transporter, partial [Candidatus Eiseniibacteriota bacterium]
GGLIIGAWSPIIAISLLSTTKIFSPNIIPLALALNISIGGIILLIGSRLNPDTRNANLN